MKTLIIHHLEDCWEQGYKNRGTSFSELCEKFGKYLTQNEFDKVILTRWENHEAHAEDYIYESDELEDFDGEQYPVQRSLTEFIHNVHTYCYGWDFDMIKNEDDEIPEKNENGEYTTEHGETYCEGGSHSQIVLVDDWMKQLPKENVFISGAFDGECVEDLEIALTHLNIDYTRVSSLIV